MRLYYAFVFLLRLQTAIGFQPPLGRFLIHPARRKTRAIASSPSNERRKRKESVLFFSSSPPPPSDAKNLSVREIKAELTEAGVEFADCFDKESLLKRLQDFRDGSITSSSSSSTIKEETTTASAPTPAQHDNERSTSSSSSSSSFAKKEIDRDALVQEVRSMRVKELREELARRHLRWAGMLEKEDLVQAVLAARLQAANFSVTGLVSPGEVADLTGDQVQQELAAQPGGSLLLVDAYAVWCGPCKLMAGEIEKAATVDELRQKVRFVKMDTDKYPTQAGNWRVQGLPTLILFDGSTGKEISRIEGAMMKDQLVQWIKTNGKI